MSLLKNGRVTGSKYGIILNILVHYSKYKKISYKDVIIKNVKEENYQHFNGKKGYVQSFEYENFKNPLNIYFFDIKATYCFNFKEIEVVKYD